MRWNLFEINPFFIEMAESTEHRTAGVCCSTVRAVRPEQTEQRTVKFTKIDEQVEQSEHLLFGLWWTLSNGAFLAISIANGP